MGATPKWIVKGKSHLEMDDLGVPLWLRTPPCVATSGSVVDDIPPFLDPEKMSVSTWLWTTCEWSGRSKLWKVSKPPIHYRFVWKNPTKMLKPRMDSDGSLMFSPHLVLMSNFLSASFLVLLLLSYLGKLVTYLTHLNTSVAIWWRFPESFHHPGFGHDMSLL